MENSRQSEPIFMKIFLQFMVVGWKDCHSTEWTTAYSGYLMADFSEDGNKVMSDPICVDSSPSEYAQVATTQNNPQIHFVLSGKGLWFENKPIPCAVCIRETDASR